jgi:hypothetical protein
MFKGLTARRFYKSFGVKGNGASVGRQVLVQSVCVAVCTWLRSSRSSLFSSLEVINVMKKCKHSVSTTQIEGRLGYKTSPSVISTEVSTVFCGNATKDTYTVWAECRFLDAKPTSALAHFCLAET